MRRSRSSDIVGLAGAALLVGGAALAGSLFSYDGASGWYRVLEKPGWTPAAWVFGPVWTGLYILMALSCWLVWLRRDKSNVWPALWVFVVQLVLNAVWSWLFFGLRRPDLALIDIIVLLAVILANLIVFCRISSLAGLLLLPYALWTAFAAVLNAAIWRLNA